MTKDIKASLRATAISRNGIGSRGFGFLLIEGETDVFIHVDTLNRSGFEVVDLKPKSTVDVEYATKPDGRRVAIWVYQINDKLATVQRHQPKVDHTVVAQPKQPGADKRQGDRRVSKGKQSAPAPKIAAIIGQIYVGRLISWRGDHGVLQVLSDNQVADCFVNLDRIPRDLHPPQVGDRYDFKVVLVDGKRCTEVLQEHDGQFADIDEPLMALGDPIGLPPFITNQPRIGSSQSQMRH